MALCLSKRNNCPRFFVQGNGKVRSQSHKLTGQGKRALSPFFLCFFFSLFFAHPHFRLVHPEGQQSIPRYPTKQSRIDMPLSKTVAKLLRSSPPKVLYPMTSEVMATSIPGSFQPRSPTTPTSPWLKSGLLLLPPSRPLRRQTRPPSTPDGSLAKSPTLVVVISNPGVGKSTLLGVLGGKFKSGFSEVSGMTMEVTIQEVERFGRNIRLVDMPGIYDPGEGRAE